MVSVTWFYDGAHIYHAEDVQKRKSEDEAKCLKCDGTGWVWVEDPREPRPQPMPCPNGCLRRRMS